MKATQKDFLRGPPPGAAGCRIFFFCGPDEAGASAAASRLAAALPDPGERVELAGADLKRDPALLGDEARSASLFGDKRHIWVRASGDDAHDALQFLIETAEAGAGEAAPVFVVATSATDKSRTAKLLEKRKDALVAMFHPPDLSAVAQAVRAMADAAGLRLGGDLAERIARAAGLDVRLAQSEVTKLALYVGADPQAPKPATPEDHAAIGAATEEDGFAPLVNAVLGGELGKVASEIRRMRELGLNPVGVALALERRAAQLAQIAAYLGPRGNFDSIDKGAEMRLGIFFKEKRDIANQFKRWTMPAARGSQETRLDRLIPRLAALHRSLLANSQAAELLLAQELAEIVRFAAKR
ncbi:DNA polymerase III subunit delta [Erythrobacter sp. BLCC-B19]|uniref:DNA polymerase III subunit delta n=1 Tax=Erythrobacter sp. BLCC-B19 TaxID=3025315 RepID=UPI002360390D|nr:DNA polymerase III subunit delta [Erythrobacter sp. BLCC-B19]WDA42479.1 DNA polymerase III subunit delta [Erythrobacter sp. BLCC-B19]